MKKSTIKIEWGQDAFSGGGVHTEMEHVKTHEVKHVLASLLTTMCEQDGESVMLFILHHMMAAEKVSDTVVKEKATDELSK